MTQAVSVRRDGDAFQARIFWLKAAKLLDDEGNIIRVGFESGLKGFDDVWVEYDPKRGPQDPFGRPILVERLQCKWHARPGQFTHADLTLPEFINATSTSFLQRAHGAFGVDRARNIHSRMGLVTNYRIDPNDTLSTLIRTKSHSLRVDELFEGKTPRSKTGALRQLWLQHLGIDEDQLRALCTCLGFSYTRDSLDELRDQLDDTFGRYGLKRIDPQASASVYDDTPFAWASQGRLEFDRKAFREACKREGLLADQTPRIISYGIKSFEHAFDRLEDRCEAVLNLVPEFDERFIRDSDAWRTKLQPAIGSFLSQAAAQSTSRVRLAIDTHATLAFAAGAVLNTKSGRLVEIEQRTPDRRVWAPDDQPISGNWPSWQFESIEMNAEATGIAVAICVTHDVVPKVRQFLATAEPVRQLLIARLTGGGASQQAIVCGAHANHLAEALAAQVKSARASSAGNADRAHLFIAAPNAFTFYLGRHVQSVKPLTLYEFDFELQRDGSYRASLSFPEAGIPPSTAMPAK